MNEEKSNVGELRPAVHFLPTIPVGITKAKGDSIAKEFVDTLMDVGAPYADYPLQMAEAFSGIDYIVSKIKEDKRYIEFIRDEIAKHGKEGYTSPSGAVLECMEAGVKYDFSSDAEWVALNENVVEATKARKIREDYLKKIPAGTQIVLEGVILAEAPTKKSTSTYKVSLFGERSKKS